MARLTNQQRAQRKRWDRIKAERVAQPNGSPPPPPAATHILDVLTAKRQRLATQLEDLDKIIIRLQEIGVT